MAIKVRNRSRLGKRLRGEADWGMFVTQMAGLSRVHQVPMTVCRGSDGEVVLVLGAASLEGLRVVAGVDMRERAGRVTAAWRLRRDGWDMFTAGVDRTPRRRGRPRQGDVAALAEAGVAGDDAEVVS